MEPSDQGVSGRQEVRDSTAGGTQTEPLATPPADSGLSGLGLSRIALQAAGALAALAGLAGAWRGSLVLLGAGAVALTLGRRLYRTDVSLLVAFAALAVLGGAVVVGALRWGSPLLTDMRGAQAVLGPSVLVAPTAAAAGCWIALASGVVGLAVWLARPARSEGSSLAAWSLEMMVGSLALVSAFWGPTITGAVDVLQWLVALAVVSAIAWGLSKVVPNASVRWLLLVLAPQALILAAAGALVSLAT